MTAPPGDVPIFAALSGPGNTMLADRAAFHDKVVVITGAASGIGAGLAEAFLGVGACLCLADVETVALRDTARRLNALQVRTDVSSLEDVRHLAEVVLGEYGRVDIVCNNAGVSCRKPWVQLDAADIAWTLGVNLWGVIYGCEVFVPIIERTSAGGHLINTASMAALAPMPGQAAYAPGKAAVVALSEVLAQELRARAARVGVSVLVPGLVRSRLASSERNRPHSGGMGSGGMGFGGIGAAGIGTAGGPTPPGRMIEAERIGRMVLRGIMDGEFYLPTHPELISDVRARHAEIEAAFARAAARWPAPD